MTSLWFYVFGLASILALIAPIKQVNGHHFYNLSVSITLDSHPDEILWILYELEYTDNDIKRSIIWQEEGIDYDPHDELDFTLEIEEGCYWLNFNDTTDEINADIDGTYGWYYMQLNGQNITHGRQAIGNFSASTYGIFTFCTKFFDLPEIGSGNFTNFEGENILYLDTYGYYGEIIILDLEYQYDWATVFYNPEYNETNSIITSELPVADGCYEMLFWSYDWWNGDYWYNVKINNLTLISRYESESDWYTFIDFCTNDTGPLYEYEYIEQNCNDSSRDTLEFQFNIKFDAWPEEVTWKLTNEHTSEVVVKGKGSQEIDYSEIWHASCISEGCYHFEIFDSYGDGMYHYFDDYGWFRVYLEGVEISLGKQAIEGDGLTMYFCTDFLVNGNNTLIINTNYDDTLFEIYDENDNELFYQNDFIVPQFLQDVDDYESSEATLYIGQGCFDILASNSFDVRINGRSAVFQLLDTHNGEVIDDVNNRSKTSISSEYIYEAAVCDSFGSANTDINGSIVVIIVMIGIIIIAGAIAIISLRLKDNRQLEQQQQQANNSLNDQLAQEPQKTGTNTGGGAAGWDMGTLGPTPDNTNRNNEDEDDAPPVMVTGDPTPR